MNALQFFESTLRQHGLSPLLGIFARGADQHFSAPTGLELRTEYGPEDMVASQLFRGADADERLAESADQWRRVLIAKEFHEIAT